MAFKCRCYVENQDGPIEGNMDDGSFLVFEINFEVYLPYDTEQNKATGSRRITPFTLTCEKGKQTPLIVKTLCEGQTCPKIQLDWYQIDDKGTESIYFTTLFENAKIIQIKEIMPSTKYKDLEKIGYLDVVSFVSQNYTWTHVPSGVEYTESMIV
ncbi:type VI secretion system tube protein Hcp [candidate division KSB1 bacterium]|nr:type VI secretion system tube protein Hcp [candidate division KSB1 bacterium]